MTSSRLIAQQQHLDHVNNLSSMLLEVNKTLQESERNTVGKSWVSIILI